MFELSSVLLSNNNGLNRLWSRNAMIGTITFSAKYTVSRDMSGKNTCFTAEPIKLVMEEMISCCGNFIALLFSSDMNSYL